MGHSYNNGLHTSSKGITVDAVRITALDQATQVVAEDCKSGLISGVTKGATGTYTFQLTKPYPPKLVICQPAISRATTTTDLLFPNYQSGSYNATTGQFVIIVSNDDDAGAPVANDGNPTDELHVFLMFNRYTR